VIEWLSRADPNRPFLVTAERSWSYRETLDEVTGRLSREPRVLRPTLAAVSVFELMAGIAGGGVTVTGPGIETAPVTGSAPLVVFTSGSTGAPKGVRLTMSNLTAAARASASHLGHGVDDTWVLAMPLHHVGGISILVRQAWTGGAVRLLPGFEPTGFAAALHDVTMASVVPTMLTRLVEHGPYQGLRAVLVGGGPIPEGLLERAVEVGLPVLPSYGLTETFGQVATLRPGTPVEKKAHHLPGVELDIVDKGRIAVRGDQVSPGYVGEADREDPWFVTGDLGSIDPDGAIRVFGRADTVIVTGGENVSPEQVESALMEHPRVETVVIVGLPHPEWGQQLSAVYVGDVEEDELRAWAADRLPGYMRPKRWMRVNRIPSTTLGKPDRTAVLRLCLDADG